MVSLANVRRLLEFSDHRQHQCMHELNKALRSLLSIECELHEIERQAKGLNELLKSHRTEDQRLSHAQLLALLRRQAVIRRQIGNLALDRAQVMERHVDVTQGIESLQQQRKVLQKKRLKYQGLEQRMLVEHRLHLWRQEENDIEELLVNLK
jgi:hypothetical protein